MLFRSFGACVYCGYCTRFGCEANAKGSAHITVIPIAMKSPNFELRTNSWVTKILKDSTGKKVTGVTYTNILNGEEYEQPAGMVLVCAYALNNVHLLLLSGIGVPYDPVTGKGVVGKNYCYQTGANANLFFEGRNFNPFMGGGGTNISADDFNINVDFDRAKAGFIGGYSLSAGTNTGVILRVSGERSTKGLSLPASWAALSYPFEIPDVMKAELVCEFRGSEGAGKFDLKSLDRKSTRLNSSH